MLYTAHRFIYMYSSFSYDGKYICLYNQEVYLLQYRELINCKGLFIFYLTYHFNSIMKTFSYNTVE